MLVALILVIMIGYEYFKKIIIMRTITNQHRADRVVNFYKKFFPSRRETYSHFKAEGVARSTIQSILDRYDATGQSKYSNKSGPKPTVATPATIKKVAKIFCQDPNISVRDAASKLKISPTSLVKCKKKADIVTRKCRKAPKYTGDHIERCKEASRNILNKTAPKHGNKIVIIDDETYCYLDPLQIPGPRYYSIVPQSVRNIENELIQTGKFEKKMGVWQAISTDGKVSPPVFIDKTMNSEKYLNLCLKKVLIPWIKENFDIKNCLFWPDLASYHYTEAVTQYLKEQNLEYITREQNAPNLPQCRPIERYWSLVKQEMRGYKTIIKTPEEFKRRWKKSSKIVIENSGAAIMENFRQKLLSVRRGGPLQVLTNRQL